MKSLTPSQEWTAFNRLHEKGASLQERLAFARGMRDTKNRQAALRHLRPPTTKQKRESAERKRSLDSISDVEIRRHCQFAGLPKL